MDILNDFDKMIEKSWTYAKMTQQEKDKWYEILTSNRTKECIKGTYKQKWTILNAIYGAYLFGLGYTDFNWRESGE